MRGLPRLPVVAISLAVVLTLLGSSTEAATASMRGRMLHAINHKRHAHHMHRLRLNQSLSRRAGDHTRKMIRQNRLFHSNTPRMLSKYNWRSWGENVGCARSVGRLMRKFMNSAPHRANILGRGFRRVGIGLAVANRRSLCGRGSVWVTQVFYG
jgi:uncharacterized protein YkwD